MDIAAAHAAPILLLVALASPAAAQQNPADTAAAGSAGQNATQADETLSGTPHGKLLQVPVNTFIPGAAAGRPKIRTPDLQDSAAIQRGMRAFNAFNCVGCHMSNGGGGMGPALSNSVFIYGGEPENIYLTIVQGRPNGMPAWGAVLPEEITWDLVAYVLSLSKEPQTSSWGVTVSAGKPDIEQVPAELQSTAKPWDHTQKFSNGQKP
jgi:cytochrome c oxidase cbb3-type subunit 3